VEGKLRWWRRRTGFALIETIVLSPSHGEQNIIEADYIIFAAGSRPGYDGLGLKCRFVNSTELLQRRGESGHLLVIGGIWGNLRSQIFQ
jgi:pyruvate/2-oxoglutarate dehydrogenase complex dihydrolipoamide dehydrogenase (E3) component